MAKKVQLDDSSKENKSFDKTMLDQIGEQEKALTENKDLYDTWSNIKRTFDSWQIPEVQTLDYSIDVNTKVLRCEFTFKSFFDVGSEYDIAEIVKSIMGEIKKRKAVKSVDKEIVDVSSPLSKIPVYIFVKF